MEEKEYSWARICNAAWGGGKILCGIVRRFKDPSRVAQVDACTLMSATGSSEDEVEEFLRRLKTPDSSQMRKLRKSGIRCITLHDESYPKILMSTSSPPPILFVHGHLPADLVGFAIVGSRRATGKGKEIARRLSAALTDRGFVIVSGMARGIDSSAHEACLDTGGRTVAVLGCGIDVPYPPENCVLLDAVSRSGAVVTEYPPGYPPLAMNFPARNRVISGLSCGVLVVEAAKRSGALITAYLALDEGREVFAVPGDIDRPKSEGANELIKRGAKLVQTVDDILEELPQATYVHFGPNDSAGKQRIELDKCESSILTALNGQALTLDQLMRDLACPPGEIMKGILDLELKGLIARDPGGLLRARIR
jgi:DNA processing protein